MRRAAPLRGRRILRSSASRSSLSGRLLDRAVAVEKQPVVAANDDAQIARQVDCIAQAPMRAHQSRCAGRNDRRESGRAGAAARAILRAIRGQRGRGAEHARLFFGDARGRLQHLDRQRHGEHGQPAASPRTADSARAVPMFRTGNRGTGCRSRPRRSGRERRETAVIRPYRASAKSGPRKACGTAAYRARRRRTPTVGENRADRRSAAMRRRMQRRAWVVMLRPDPAMQARKAARRTSTRDRHRGRETRPSRS